MKSNQQDQPAEQPEPHKRSHHGPKAKVGRRPPRHAAHTPRNSWTAASKIYRRRRIAEALAFREQGHLFPQIAKQMKISISTAHDYVIEALTNLVPLESAKAVLALELKRLDALLAGQWAAAIAGDTGATYAALQIVDRRARLLGLYPQTGQLAQVLVQAQASEMGVPEISFEIPSGHGSSQRLSPADVSAPPPASGGPYPWQKALPAPREQYQTPFGVVEVEGDRPAGPRTEVDPGAPRPQGGGGESRRWPSAGKPHGWME